MDLDLDAVQDRFFQGRETAEEAKDRPDDLCSLSELSEQTLLTNLQRRFAEGIIYTYVGTILVSVNPFKYLPIYNPKFGELYRARRLEDPTLRPHVFAIADDSFSSMVRDKQRQCIVISGESGSGKTEATKLLLHHVMQVSAKVPTSEELRRILGTAPVLEAFGNAKTVSNNNSSRFGKFVMLNFKSNGSYQGASIEKYLLEKSRLIQQSQVERNYHIFYLLLAGADKKLRTRFFLQTDPSKYQILSGTEDPANKCYTVSDVDDAKEFEALDENMRVFFTPNQIQQVFQLIATLLNLGNIGFAEDESGEGSVVNTNDSLRVVSNLLRVHRETLGVALVTKKTVIRGQEFSCRFKKEEAEDNKWAMGKCLYEALFDWIVMKLNIKLSGGSRQSSGDPLSIGILDIFGFEDFQKNSFEQFSINFANEQLQQYFIKHIFQLEQVEYEREGINWSSVQYVDNQSCLELLTKRPTGLFHLLDEESRLAQGNDTSLFEKFSQTHKSHACFEIPHQRGVFVIKHYAGHVTYTIDGFRDKNRDLMRQDIIHVLQNSRTPFIRELIFKESSALRRWRKALDVITAIQYWKLISKPEDADKERDLILVPNDHCKRKKSWKMAKRNSVEMRTPIVIRNVHTGGSTSTVEKEGGKKAGKSPTVGGQFMSSLNYLMETLSSASPYFVRCIKSNPSQLPLAFDEKKIITQLRYCGMLETVRIRQLGYNVRMALDKFLECFGILVPGSCTGNTRQLAQALLSDMSINDEQAQVGTTKVFMKSYIERTLQTAVHKRLTHVAVVIQRAFRGWLKRHKLARSGSQTFSTDNMDADDAVDSDPEPDSQLPPSGKESPTTRILARDSVTSIDLSKPATAMSIMSIQSEVSESEGSPRKDDDVASPPSSPRRMARSRSSAADVRVPPPKMKQPSRAMSVDIPAVKNFAVSDETPAKVSPGSSQAMSIDDGAKEGNKIPSLPPKAKAKPVPKMRETSALPVIADSTDPPPKPTKLIPRRPRKSVSSEGDATEEKASEPVAEKPADKPEEKKEAPSVEKPDDRKENSATDKPEEKKEIPPDCYHLLQPAAKKSAYCGYCGKQLGSAVKKSVACTACKASYHQDCMKLDGVCAKSVHSGLKRVIIASLGDCDRFGTCLVSRLARLKTTKKLSRDDRLFRDTLKEYHSGFILQFSVGVRNGNASNWTKFNLSRQLLDDNFQILMTALLPNHAKANVVLCKKTFSSLLDDYEGMGEITVAGVRDDFIMPLAGKSKKDEANKSSRDRKEEKMVEHNGHRFHMENFTVPTTCEQCKKTLMALEEGAVCQVCKTTVHPNCVKKIKCDCKHKGNSLGEWKGEVFGATLTQMYTVTKLHVPTVIEMIFTEIESRCLFTPGLYRKGSSAAGLKRLRAMLVNNHVGMNLELSSFDGHVLGATLKAFLRELKEATIPEHMYKSFVESANVEENRRKSLVLELIPSLPPANQFFLERLSFHLARVSQHESANNMNVNNLAIIFAPIVVVPPRSMGAMEALQQVALQSSVMEIIINSTLSNLVSAVNEITEIETEKAVIQQTIEEHIKRENDVSTPSTPQTSQPGTPPPSPPPDAVAAPVSDDDDTDSIKVAKKPPVPRSKDKAGSLGKNGPPKIDLKALGGGGESDVIKNLQKKMAALEFQRKAVTSNVSSLDVDDGQDSDAPSALPGTVKAGFQLPTRPKLPSKRGESPLSSSGKVPPKIPQKGKPLKNKSGLATAQPAEDQPGPALTHVTKGRPRGAGGRRPPTRAHRQNLATEAEAAVE